MAVATAGGFGTIIASIIKFIPKHNDSIESEKCPAHSGIVKEINYLHEGIARLEKGQDEIWIGVNEIRDDVKQLIRNI